MKGLKTQVPEPKMLSVHRFLNFLQEAKLEARTHILGIIMVRVWCYYRQLQYRSLVALAILCSGCIPSIDLSCLCE
jgi:hypothetical protein